MSLKILTVVLFCFVVGLLIAQRFSLPEQLPVRITAGAGEDAGYGFGEGLQRGSLVETTEGFIQLNIGEELAQADQAQTIIWLSKNTSIELERLYKNELIIRLIKGRILAKTSAQTPLMIKTNNTEHVLSDAMASFINYDFLETIHVIPLMNSVETYLRQTKERFTQSVPYSIHETPPVSHESLDVNLIAGDSAEFYQWTNALTY